MYVGYKYVCRTGGEGKGIHRTETTWLKGGGLGIIYGARRLRGQDLRGMGLPSRSILSS